ncbi:MAG: hypothetical protein ABSB28_05255 [Candidatus Bathyarchaeia archaeon]
MSEKKEANPLRKRRAPTALAPYRPSGLWLDFDRILIGSAVISRNFFGHWRLL